MVHFQLHTAEVRCPPPRKVQRRGKQKGLVGTFGEEGVTEIENHMVIEWKLSCAMMKLQYKCTMLLSQKLRSHQNNEEKVKQRISELARDGELILNNIV